MAAAFLGAMLLSALFTWLVRLHVVATDLRQTVRSDGPESHLQKMGTPTLGGVGMMAALIVVTMILLAAGVIVWRQAVLPALGLTLAYAAIGFADDYSKLRYKRPLGLKARLRLPLEFLLAAGYAVLLVHSGLLGRASGAAQIIPLGGGVLWIAFATLVIVGASNAVNLTDGLDGLAAGVSCLCALGVGVACFLLDRPELALWAVALAGVCAGFLWLNTPPASIFMGDVGSLGLGAALAAIAVAARIELLFALFGIIFVIEALSVIIQVVYFRATGGRRVFRMAPYHHHLELGGLPETKIVFRFWLITMAGAALGIALVALLVPWMRL